MAIQAWLVDGVDRAAELLSDGDAGETEIDVGETICCPLGDFGASGVQSEEDELVAGVLVGLRGGFSGAALLVMEPEAALEWSRIGEPDPDPIRSYLARGGQILGCVIESAGSVLEVETEVGSASLQERSLAGCLLQTHAPSDTVTIGSRLEIFADGRSFAARVFLLIEPKMLSAILRALGAAAH